jgi:hypothetical protein
MAGGNDEGAVASSEIVDNNDAVASGRNDVNPKP